MEKLKRILYAEDNPNDIELTIEAFNESKLANPIDLVRDGEEVLDYLYYRGKYKDRIEEDPAFILLDIKMPKMDGIEVLKVLRKSKEYKNLPIVMMTSSQIESDMIRSYELGVNGYVVKPVEFAELLKTIKAIGYFWAIINQTP